MPATDKSPTATATINHVVMFSGGVASYAVAKRVVRSADKDAVVLLFADTLMEDEDLYRFIGECSGVLGVPITKVTEGRTPWQVFFDVKLLGNARADPCSRILKREPLRRWLENNCDPDFTVVYIGFDGNEGHRFERAKPHWAPWKVAAPLVDEFVFKEQLFNELKDDGIERPRLYRMGFSHNNCGGFCIKAGNGHFAHLLREMPERFEKHAAQEREFRKKCGKNVSILVDRRGGGPRKPLTLDALRERISREEPIDMFDIGGCACMEPAELENG